MAMARNREAQTVRARFMAEFDFTFDDFQREALRYVEEGANVLVAAPTGAGKTIVGEFALYLAVDRGRRAFYTTPIKALSNQKYRELCLRFGTDHVGLLTGDTSIRPDADVVVMTTEVARNMVYAGADFSDVDAIILDEVHYLADRSRGPVWEEVVIHTPLHVGIVALSATVSNAEQFGEWIRQVRHSCEIVVSERRPVPLYQHMMVGRSLYDLYQPSRHDRRPLSGQLNPELRHAVAALRAPFPGGARGSSSTAVVTGGRRGRGEGARRGRGSQPRGRSGTRSEQRFGARPDGRIHVTSRAEAVVTLERMHLLPAIYFIFSRARCDEAVDHLLGAGIALTSAEERREILACVDEAFATLTGDELAAIGANRWMEALASGIAAHHAGL